MGRRGEVKAAFKQIRNTDFKKRTSSDRKWIALLQMDNVCFQDDSIIEMENVRLEDRNGKIGEKDKTADSFENPTNAKIDVPVTGIGQNNKQLSEACQPQLCQEVSKHYQKLLQTNRNFDPMLKLKSILFFMICLTLFIWCLIHFMAINSPAN